MAEAGPQTEKKSDPPFVRKMGAITAFIVAVTGLLALFLAPPAKHESSTTEGKAAEAAPAQAKVPAQVNGPAAGEASPTLKVPVPNYIPPATSINKAPAEHPVPAASEPPDDEISGWWSGIFHAEVALPTTIFIHQKGRIVTGKFQSPCQNNYTTDIATGAWDGKRLQVYVVNLGPGHNPVILDLLLQKDGNLSGMMSQEPRNDAVLFKPGASGCVLP